MSRAVSNARNEGAALIESLPEPMPGLPFGSSGGPARSDLARQRVRKLVAFSCKKRGFCPSCGARRMAETAALLADEVLPERPLRQWVSLGALCTAVTLLSGKVAA